MQTFDNELSAKEIRQRVREIRSRWDGHERLVRRLIGNARCEELESLLQQTDVPAVKAA